MFSLNPFPSLPKYAGPYNVGSTEYEVPISQIDSQTSSPDSRITTIKFRLFYPTDAASSSEPITWVPQPQKRWIQAFSSFLGASQGWSGMIKPILSILNYITVPAIANAPLRQGPGSQPKPLAIFSHGLAGNCNMYSAICGSLASCGVLCVAAEHRDGSSPISWIRGPGGKIESEVAYEKYAHDVSPEVFNGRNTQLRIRMWELDLLYSALNKLNDGDSLMNYAAGKSETPMLKSSMDFAPGHVSWLGHSFGAATITQFVKSIYYRRSLPSAKPSKGEQDHAPLYTPSSKSKLIEQITPDSPVALLDVWTLPFRAPSTQWLWAKPFPCYDRKASADSHPSTIAIMSTEFYNYTDLCKRTRALLSADPVQAERTLARQSSSESPTQPAPASPRMSTPPYKGQSSSTTPESDTLPAPAMTLPIEQSSAPSTRDPSPAASSSTSISTSTDPSPPSPPTTSPSSSHTSLSLSPTPQLPTTPSTPRLFYIPSSAHLSQSDFGLLFPALTKYLMKAVDPEGTIILNVRAITAVMRGGGLDVRMIDEPQTARGAKRERAWFSWARKDEGVRRGGEDVVENEVDRIVIGDEAVEGAGGRWIEIPLIS